MRRWVVAAVVGVGIMGVAFGVSWWFLSSPYWSLYQIGKGVCERDPQRVLPYLDMDSIIEHMIRHKAAGELQGTDRWAAALGGAVARAMAPQLKLLIAKVIADPKRSNIDSPWALVFAAKVQTSGDRARVVLEDGNTRRLRGVMARRGGRWVVVEINPDDLEALVGH